MINTSRKINICRPGFNASCALCCGSHNYCTNSNEISDIFKKRTTFIAQSRSKINDPSLHVDVSLKNINGPKLVSDGIQCHYIGFDTLECKKIGCLAYHDKRILNHKDEIFFFKTCKTFECFSYTVLSDSEIIFAAKLMQDWFYYSLLINDINILRNLHKMFLEPENVPASDLISAKNILEEKLFSS